MREPVRPALHPHAAVALPPAERAPAPREPEPKAPAAPGLSVAWTLSRQAAARLLPTLGERGPDCRLTLTLAPLPDGRARAELSLNDPRAARSAEHVLRTATVPFEFIEDGDMRHAEAPGWLACTWRDPGQQAGPQCGQQPAQQPEADLLYIRSPLLAELGLPGGRYEPLRRVRLASR